MVQNMTANAGNEAETAHKCSENEDLAALASHLPTIFDAVKSGMLIPVQTLVETQGHEILKSRDEKGHTPAHWVCLGGHATILRYIIEAKAPVDDASDNDLMQQPIHWACVNGHIAVVDILLQSGVTIDTMDSKGCTPLIVACQYGQTQLAGYLMGKGARLQVIDKDGDNALHWAAFKGHSEMMRLLVYSGFNPHQKDHYLQTALHLACISGNLTSVQELCELDNVDIDHADKNGKTPLLLAKGRKHDKIVHYLTKQAKVRNSILPRLDFWAIVFGPPGNSKGPIMFFIFSMLFWGYPMYVIKCLPVTWYEFQFTHLLFMASNAVMWVCLYHAATTDPGFLPRNVPEYDRAIKEVAHFHEWKQGANPLSRLCHTCRTVKPIRSKHCRVCNRCVRMFDHHCPYIYNCVGIRNRVWFTGFVATMMLNGLTASGFAIHVLSLLGRDWLLLLGLLEILFFTGIAVVVFTFTVYQALINLTTNERINKKRYDYLKDGRGVFYNPYDKGWQRNVLEFLHFRKPQQEDDANFLNITIV